MLLPLLLPALPTSAVPWPFPRIADAETVTGPEYLGVSVLPNGQVGVIFVNDEGAGQFETRFKRYFVESGMDQSMQLSTSSGHFPQLASFQGQLIAAYVDNRSGSPTLLQLRFRVSADNGASWGAEYSPFGAETFDAGFVAPLLIASRDGTRLYLFTAANGSVPQFRYTLDPTLVTWTAPQAAGDGTMHLVAQDQVGDAGTDQRTHNFEFTETAVAGQWLYIAQSDEGVDRCARGTQVGTLGGSWSTQVPQGGGCGTSGSGGEGRATAFLDRVGNIYYVRPNNPGGNLYFKKSTDGGLTWSAATSAYSSGLDYMTVTNAIGLYVPGYSRGEYVWYDGWGGLGAGNDQSAVRVIPIWTGPAPYYDTGSVRLFGTLGGDYDFGAAYPYTFGRRDIPTGIGAYKTSAQDLSIPGRRLDFSFDRTYSSADNTVSVIGPAWTFSYNWSVIDDTNFVELRRGDGRRDLYTRNQDGSYAHPPNVFDVLTKNGDNTFTLTLKNQTQYEFSTAGKLTRIHEPAGNQIVLSYITGKLASITDTVGRTVNLSYSNGLNLSQNKTYTTSSPPNVAGGSLTDGVIGSASSFGDGQWEGYLNVGTLDVTVDLGATQSRNASDGAGCGSAGRASPRLPGHG